MKKLTANEKRALRTMKSIKITMKSIKITYNQNVDGRKRKDASLVYIQYTYIVGKYKIYLDEL